MSYNLYYKNSCGWDPKNSILIFVYVGFFSFFDGLICFDFFR